MQTRTRVTVTVPDAVLQAARRDVESGVAPSLSAWITDAAEAKVRRESLGHVLDELLEASGGPLTKEETEWARAQLQARESSTLARSIAIEKGDRKVLALCKIATLDSGSLVVPAGVIGQVWRDGARHAQVARLIEADGTTVETLDLQVAKLAGAYCGHAGTTDVVDATVVIAARQHHALDCQQRSL